MLITALYSWKALTVALLSGGLVLVTASTARKHHPDGTERDILVEHLRSPVSTSLSTLAILLPIFAGVVAYLYQNSYATDYSLAIPGCVLLFVALRISI